MSSKRLRSGPGKMGGSRAKYWDTLPWKAIDTSNENLGEFEESVFFGLEEVDGNAFLLNKQGGADAKAPSVEDGAPENVETEVKSKKSKKLNKRKFVDTLSIQDAMDADSSAPTDEVVESDEVITVDKKDDEAADASAAAATEEEDTGKKGKKVLTTEQKIEKYKRLAERKAKIRKLKEEATGVTSPTDGASTVVTNSKSNKNNQGQESTMTIDESADWGGIKMNNLLHKSLIKLSFESPTPIQLSAIPRIIAGGSDIVGAAETGSGKTLVSFSLLKLPTFH